jgi:hypothetical protein
MLNVLPKKQVVYFKNPPSDYYDLNRRGGNPFEDTVLDSLFEYDGKEWHKGITMYEDDIEDEWIICR